jgi:hypothetical protein
MGSEGQLDEEIESWKGFPWALRKEDRELWDAMIKEVREDFKEAIEESGKDLTTDPFFMALLLAQQRLIVRLQTELKALKIDKSSACQIKQLTRPGSIDEWTN